MNTILTHRWLRPKGLGRRNILFSNDITLAKELLGFEPKVSLEEGLSAYIDWFRAEHQGEY